MNTNHTVEYNNKTYALMSPIVNISDENKTEWLSKDFESLQGSRMHYMAGKVFEPHSHKLVPRIINHTQEAFVVIRGKISIEIFEEDEKTKEILFLGKLSASSGDILFVWRGIHKLIIEEDYTIVYELKAGQFQGYISDEKKYYPNLKDKNV